MSLESAIVSYAVQKLGDVLIQEAGLLFCVEGQIQSLQRELTWISSHIKDVDERLEEGNETFRLRIREIRKISFDVEDAIDSFILAGGTRRGKSLIQRYFCCFNYVAHTCQIAIEIKAIKTRINESTEMLKKYQVEETTQPIQRRRPLCNPNYNDDNIVGLGNDIEKLVNELTTENSQKSIMCIHGMGGSGKTTLAKKLYNHQIVKRHFKSQAWVSISKEWNTQEILVKIRRQVTGEKDELDEEELLEELWKCLEQTSYLIVLDDVWKEESLQDLLPKFPINIERSRIIITTRIREVVQFPDLSCFFHEPPRLNKDDSWALFRKVALDHRKSVDIKDFEKLGEQMLQKCEGLPLAIVALGGILKAKETRREWEMISKAVSARIMKEDRVIYVEELIRMWVAEGFVISQPHHGEETLEDVAEQFLDELIQRHVIQIEKRNYEGRVTFVRIHDLVRDLCIKKAKERQFLELFTSNSSVATTQEDGTVTQSRRVSIFTSSSSIDIPDQIQNSHVQSLFVFATDTHQPRARSSLGTMYKNFRSLKVLIIEDENLSDTFRLDGIGNLTLLRYLKLRVGQGCRIPKSIGNLRNLLTFYFFTFGSNPPSLPDVFWKMEKLRHLHLDFNLVYQKGLKLHTLRNLQTLWGVRGGDWMLKEMSILSPTITKLQILDISTEEQLEAIFQCPSVVLDHLHTLGLLWNSALLKPQQLELLCGCHHLRELLLAGKISEDQFSPVQFPPNLMKLCLWCTELARQEALSTLGKLSNLRHLELEYKSYIGTEWTCSTGEFPQLKELELCSLPNLEEWRVEAGAMPHLSNLIIEDCQKTKRLPEGLRHIAALKEPEIRSMPEEFYETL